MAAKAMPDEKLGSKSDSDDNGNEFVESKH